MSSPTEVATQVTSVASGNDQAPDGAYALARGDQMAGPALEDNVEEDQKADAEDIVQEQLELEELIGEYALDKKAKLVAEMNKARRKTAFGALWLLVCFAMFEVLYQTYVKPAASNMQEAYRKMHPGREPTPLTVAEILLASPVATGIATAITVALVMIVSDLYTNLYTTHAKSMDLNTLLEEEQLEEQEKAAKKKAAESGLTAEQEGATKNDTSVSSGSP